MEVLRCRCRLSFSLASSLPTCPSGENGLSFPSTRKALTLVTCSIQPFVLAMGKGGLPQDTPALRVSALLTAGTSQGTRSVGAWASAAALPHKEWSGVSRSVMSLPAWSRL